MRPWIALLASLLVAGVAAGQEVPGGASGDATSPRPDAQTAPATTPDSASESSAEPAQGTPGDTTADASGADPSGADSSSADPDAPADSPVEPAPADEAAPQDPADVPDETAYVDPSGFISVRFPEHWERWQSEVASRLIGNARGWPDTTAVFSLQADPLQYTCPCVWVARFENARVHDYQEEMRSGAFPIAALERLSEGPDQVPPLTGENPRYYHDSLRNAVWIWQDFSASDGERMRMAMLYVPAGPATVGLLYQGTPKAFDRELPQFLRILDSVHLQKVVRNTAPSAEMMAADAAPSAVRRAFILEGALLLQSVAGALALAVALALFYGWRAGGPLFAGKCLVLVAVTSTALLGNFVIELGKPKKLDLADLLTMRALLEAAAAALLIPALFAAVAKYRGLHKRGLTNAWLLGCCVGLCALASRLLF